MTEECLRLPLLRDWHTHPLLYAAFIDGIDLSRDPAQGRDLQEFRSLLDSAPPYFPRGNDRSRSRWQAPLPAA